MNEMLILNLLACLVSGLCAFLRSLDAKINTERGKL